jgi:hypothetical protein
MLIGYSIITCCHEKCGISFAAPERWQKARRDDHSWFYCPNGHRQHYSCDSEEEKLRRERDRLKQQLAYKDDVISEKEHQIEQAHNSAKAYKGHVTRIKNRVSAGICPCCNRHFENLQKHMETKHKGYKKEDAA